MNTYNAVINILSSNSVSLSNGAILVRLMTRIGLTTKEIAVISIFASLWIASQIALGPTIHSVTRISGVINRVLGWALMLMLARLSRKMGRVSLMSIVAALVTRIIRSTGYGMVMFLGYSLGGIIFDLLYFFPMNLRERAERMYIVVISVISGVAVLVPYLLFKFWVLGPRVFVGFVPIYAYSILKGTTLSLVGIILGLIISPRVERVWLSENPRP